jgi:hypothetical protein
LDDHRFRRDVPEVLAADAWREAVTAPNLFSIPQWALKTAIEALAEVGDNWAPKGEDWRQYEAGKGPATAARAILLAVAAGESPKLQAVACKAAPACKIPVIFAEGPNGTVVLDAKAPVYRVVERDGLLVAERMADCFVTHFATCKDPNRFSGGKSRKEAEGGGT